MTQGLGAWLGLMTPPGFAFADQHQGQMRKRREVATGAHRSARRDDGMDAAIQELDEQLEGFDSDAGESLGEHVCTQRHCRAHNGNRQAVADASGMTAEQVDLEVRQRVCRNPHLCEIAEARVDAVRRFVAAREVVNERSRGAHARAGAVGNGDRSEVVRDGGEVLERQTRAVQLNGSRHRAGCGSKVPRVPKVRVRSGTLGTLLRRSAQVSVHSWT